MATERPIQFLAPAIAGSPVDPDKHLEFLEDAEAHMLPSVAFLQTVTINPLVTRVFCLGWAAPGDGGHGERVRVGAVPAHPAYVTDAGGAIWELVADRRGSWPEQHGAVLGTTADNSAAVQDWVDFVAAVARKGTGCGTYRCDQTVTIPNPDGLHFEMGGSDWVLNADTLLLDLNGAADPTYPVESHQNFTWRGGVFRCWFGSPTKAAAIRALGFRKAVIEPEEINNFHTGVILGGKDTVRLGDTKFFNNEIDVEFPPWSVEGGPIRIDLQNLHHSHGGKTQPCVKSYVPLNASRIWGCSYNLGSNATCVAVDLQKAVLLGVSGGAGTWVPGETVTGAGGATMVLDEVYDHPHPFQVAQNTRWLVGHTRTGSFVAGETVTGGTSGATAVIGADTAYVIDNVTWTGFAFGGTAHFEVGTGGAGATGIRIRDRINNGGESWSFDIDVGQMALSKGGAIGVDLQNVQHATIRGYFSLENGGTDKVLRTDADCRDVAIVKPFRAPFGTIDLNGMAASELDMSAFDKTLSPTSFGVGGALVTTAATLTAIPDNIAVAIAGRRPRAYRLRVYLRDTAASAATNCRWRAFATGVTAEGSKQALQIKGWSDSVYYWADMQVDADANGQFEWDATVAGGGSVTVQPQIVGVLY